MTITAPAQGTDSLESPPQVTVNGRHELPGDVGGQHPALTGCATAASPAPRRAAPRASAGPAPCWSPGRTARRRGPHAGPRSTPAWSRRPAWTTRRSITAEGLGAPDGAAPGAAGDGGPRRVPVRLLHTGFHLLHGVGVLPGRQGSRTRRRPDDADETLGTSSTRSRSTARTASTCTPCPGTCAAAPATDRSRTPPTPWACRPRTTRFAARLAAPAAGGPAHPDRQSRTASSSGRPACPRRSAARRPPGRGAGRRLHRLGRRAEHPASRAPLRHRHRPAPRAARLEVGEDWIDIGAALTLTEIERRLAGRIPLLATCFRSSPPG